MEFRVLLVIFSDFWFLAVSMISVLLVGLISGSGSVGASLTECSTSRGKFTSGEFSKNWGVSI